MTCESGIVHIIFKETRSECHFQRVDKNYFLKEEEDLEVTHLYKSNI